MYHPIAIWSNSVDLKVLHKKLAFCFCLNMWKSFVLDIRQVLEKAYNEAQLSVIQKSEASGWEDTGIMRSFWSDYIYQNRFIKV